MKRYSAFACALLVTGYYASSHIGEAQAKRNESPAAPAQAPHAADMRAQQQQAQEQAIRNQQAEARQSQQIELKAQEESRQNQERALVAQEEQARKSQQDAIRAQQAQARQAQEATRGQQSEARQAQEESAKAERQQAQEEKQAQQEQARQAQEASRNADRQQRSISRGRADNGLASAPPPGFSPNTAFGANESHRSETGSNNFAINNRAVEPKPITERSVPLQTATSMPVLDAGATQQQREHFQKVQTNLQNHLYAVSLRQAPPNMIAWENNQRENYTNNYRAFVNNQDLYINRQNTLCNVVAANEWPYWYRPEPNYQFCNGFTIGSAVQSGLDWLRWGWHPYYGPQPDGFVCANDYVPTPWIYVPAYDLWRQPGVLGWAPGGPPYDYTGPISVEVLEPRTVNVRDPYTGWNSARTINVVYMYNAFFYPDDDRWGYRNRHNYFIWVNI